MELSKFKERYPIFLRLMKEKGYYSGYIDKYAGMARLILQEGGDNSISTYEQFYAHMVEHHSYTEGFQEGERFYNYRRYVANYVSPSSCVLAPRNFSFSHYESGYTSILSEFGLFCNARSDRDSMAIYTTAQIEREINGVVFNGCQFWFYKLN